jgi:hypothetical protein
MRESNHSDLVKKFEDEWRTWAERPPVVPAEDAASRVMNRLPVRRRILRHRPILAAASVLAVLLIAVLIILSPGTSHRKAPAPPLYGTLILDPSLPDDMVLILLAPDTPRCVSSKQHDKKFRFIDLLDLMIPRG